MGEIKLKPCPFCGCEDINIRERDHSVRDNETELRLWCDRCGGSTYYYDNFSKAAKAWNRRVRR